MSKLTGNILVRDELRTLRISRFSNSNSRAVVQHLKTMADLFVRRVGHEQSHDKAIPSTEHGNRFGE